MNTIQHDKQSTSSLRSTLIRGSLFAALLGVMAVPATSAAMESSASVTPTPAFNTNCGQSVVALEVDTSTGQVYVLDANTGQELPLNDDLVVCFGTLNSVLLDVEFDSGDWLVDITPSGSTTQTYQTRGGALRYYIDASHTEYTLDITPLDPGQTVPVPPITIKRPPPPPPPT